MDFSQGYNRVPWINFLEGFLPDDFLAGEEAIRYSGKFTKNVTKLGESASLQLSVFEIKHNSVNDARVGLSKEAFTLVRDHTKYNKALALFVPQSNNETYRFSYIEFTPVLDESGKIKRNYTNPRRYSYILGKDAKVKTPQQYLKKEIVKDAAELKNRFSVEVLTKEFYNKLFDWYDKWAIEEIKFPAGSGSTVTLKKGEQNRIHLIRLLTRFIFIWFIKQKNLIPGWIFDKEKIKEVLKEFDSESLTQGNYYNGIIQNLFFATLNKPIKEREFAFEKSSERKEDYGIKTKYRDNLDESMFYVEKKEFISRFDSVPFLNGGLFECLDNFDTKEYIDGFSREKERRAFVPNALFWGKEDRLGLIELFNTYNFTVEENTPQDIDVALDPELLGKAFENLLGTFNDETKKTARNESGSFYTPREIVDYMIDTSLKEYILSDFDESSRHKLDSLFSYSDDISNFSTEERHFLIEKIHNCRILDPACGSGAFPMGILNKLTFILEKLDPDNEKWKEMQRQKAIKETEAAYKIGKKQERDDRLKEISNVFEMNSGNYGRKLYLLENCIHGVDLQPIAIQISKLRFFISLIVDQKTGGTKSNNYNVLPLPNLETKFVAANALISVNRLKKGDQGLLIPDEIEEKQKELLEIRHQYFSTRNAKDKIKLRDQDKALTKSLSDLLENDRFFNSADAAMLASWNPYCQTKPSGFLDADWMFGIKDGFDIVIGNPPYIQLQNNRGELADTYGKSNYECFSRSGDIYQLFYERGYGLLKKNGHLCFITSNKWMRAAYGEKTRSFFADKANPKILIDFAGQRVFESATVDVNILLLEKEEK